MGDAGAQALTGGLVACDLAAALRPVLACGDSSAAPPSCRRRFAWTHRRRHNGTRLVDRALLACAQSAKPHHVDT